MVYVLKEKIEIALEAALHFMFLIAYFILEDTNSNILI